MTKKLKWYEVRKEDVTTKRGIVFIHPNKYPFWKYLLPFVKPI